MAEIVVVVRIEPFFRGRKRFVFAILFLPLDDLMTSRT